MRARRWATAPARSRSFSTASSSPPRWRISPLAYRGHDIILFELLDPQEVKPGWRESVVLEDVETHRTLNVSPEYLEGEYRRRLEGHVESLRQAAANVGAHQLMVQTDEPLDRALRRYLLFRQGRGSPIFSPPR